MDLFELALEIIRWGDIKITEVYARWDADLQIMRNDDGTPQLCVQFLANADTVEYPSFTVRPRSPVYGSGQLVVSERDTVFRLDFVAFGEQDWTRGREFTASEAVGDCEEHVLQAALRHIAYIHWQPVEERG